MRYSIRVAPGVRLRPSRRGIGVSLGKGRTWLYLGPTGAGASTGVGAVRFYPEVRRACPVVGTVLSSVLDVRL